jgi:hypothetical protein
MTQFSTTHQPAEKGRPKGSKNVRGKISKEMSDKALEKLDDALNMGEAWAIQEVFKRTHPTLKAIVPTDSLEAVMLMMKIKEIQELEQRLIALEAQNNG